MRTGIRCQGDIELAEKLKNTPLVKQFTQRREQEKLDETRRYLLSTAVRLTKSMAPELHSITTDCATRLGVNKDYELYVSPSPHFNAYSYGAKGDRVFIGVTSSLFDAFSADELRFIVGHELGHHIFDHHDIPTGALMQKGSGLTQRLAISLFSWQRFAEISADRAGLECVRDVEPVAHSFLKLASGLRTDTIRYDIDDYLEQIGDIRQEGQKLRSDRAQSEWFSSHPFSPLRIRAVQLCWKSKLFSEGGNGLEQLESDVQELMSLMEPGYLNDASVSGEAMRRILFAGGVLVASAHGDISEQEIAALSQLLGEDSVSADADPDALRGDLANRVEMALEHVPSAKRGQLVRDLCVIAYADGHGAPEEISVIRDIAEKLQVDGDLIDRAFQEAATSLD